MTPPVRTDRNAEDDVGRLCRAAGASVQRVSEDDHGWDLLVEFPSRVETAFPDTDPALTRCLIQVKSVRNRRRTTRVKVSNALKFAKDALPCFVALVTYPGDPRGHEAIYLRHVWATDMAEALKAARRCAAGGQPLNRQTLTIAFTTGERVDDDLADRLLEAIAREGIDYAERKKRLSDSLGYEAGWGASELVLADGHDAQDLQDLLLGRRADLPIESITTTEARFGIPSPPVKRGPGKLSVVVKPRTRCVMTLQKRGADEQLSYPGAVFAAGLEWLPLAEQKLRVVAGPIELIIARDGSSVSSHWDAPLSAPRALDELERDARLRSWMDGGKIDMDLWSELGALPGGVLTFSPSENDIDWEAVIESLRALSRVVPPERRPEDLRTSMAALLSSLDQLTQLTTLLGADSTAIRLVNEAGLAPDLRTATHIVVPCVNRIGDHYIVSVIEREVQTALLKDDTLYMTTTRGRILRSTTLHVSGATDALVAKEVQWARERAEAGNRVVLSFHPEGDGTGTLVLSTSDDEV